MNLAISIQKYDLKNKYIRVKSDGWGGTVTCIGNIIKDKWFNLKDFFANIQTQDIIKETMNEN